MENIAEDACSETGPTYNKYVPLEEHERLKRQLVLMESEYKKLILLLELLETLCGFNLHDVVDEEILLLDETLEIGYEFKVNGMNSGGSSPAEEPNDVMVINTMMMKETQEKEVEDTEDGEVL